MYRPARATLAAVAAAVALVAAEPCALPAQPAAQQEAQIPRRPTLAAGADTNDANAYYVAGLATVGREPKTAAAAFWWAMRLDPGWAEPVYARRVALLLTDLDRLVRYMERDRRLMESPEIQRIDSLQLRALMLDPFVQRQFDRRLYVEYMVHETESRAGGEMVNRAALELQIDEFMRGHGNAFFAANRFKALIAETDGRLGDALRLYAAAAKRERDKDELAEIHAARARLFAQSGSPDSALAELTLAIAARRERGQTKLVLVYQSAEVLEHGAGLLLEQKGDREGARAAYGRALAENLAYYPAHARLGALALAAGDTTAALGELETAVQLDTADAVLRYSYALALAAAKRYVDSQAQLFHAIELDPDFAKPYALMARIFDAHGQSEEALTYYTQFLAHASRRDPQFAWTTDRVAKLKPAGAP